MIYIGTIGLDYYSIITVDQCTINVAKTYIRAIIYFSFNNVSIVDRSAIQVRIVVSRTIRISCDGDIRLENMLRWNEE